MRCECDLCKRTRDFTIAMKSVSDPVAAEVFRSIYNDLTNLEFDCDYTNANLDGSWHSSPFKELAKQINMKPFFVHTAKWKQIFNHEGIGATPVPGESQK